MTKAISLTSLKPDDLAQFDAYEHHYHAKVIKINNIGLHALYETQDKDWRTGLFMTPTNIMPGYKAPPSPELVSAE